VLDEVRHALEPLSENERNLILTENALRFYGLS
jgi:predicted TIM-barrel fold metal-dependent hydrolase